MSNCVFGFPVYSDVNQTYTPAFSGGSWSGLLPLTNLQDRRLAKVARSSSAAGTDTQFDTDLQTARAVGLIGIPRHNFSASARVRVRGSSVAGDYALIAENYILRSEELDNAAWGKSASTITANTVVDGDGLLTMDKIVETATTAQHFVSQAFASLTTNASQVFECDLKAGERTWCWIQTTFKSGGGAITYIDLANGVFGTIGAGHTVTLTALGGGLYRVTIVWNAGTGATTPAIAIGTTTANNVTSIAGNASSGLHIGRVQGRDNVAVMGNYQKTTTVAVTTSSSNVVYNSDWNFVFPSVVGMTAEHLAEITRRGINAGFVHVPATAQTARYWRIEIADAANAAGYVELGRVAITGSWQPTVNFSYGARFGVNFATAVEETDGGASIFNVKSGKRHVIGTIDIIPEDEVWSYGFDLVREQGIDKQLYFVLDPADVKHLWRRSFLGVFKEPSVIEFPYYAQNAFPFSVVEEL